jgi:hypothetical protein
VPDNRHIAIRHPKVAKPERGLMSGSLAFEADAAGFLSAAML